MIAKIVKGTSFEGVVKYILDSNKKTNILSADGVRLMNAGTIIQSFETQRELNPKVSRAVGHISLGFSVQNKSILTDEFMRNIAIKYMNKMGITNTQYIIGRHHDKEHPHLHIAFNRIDNNGHTISDKNDRFNSKKICKELTLEHGLYISSGKEKIKQYRLKEPDKTKYEIYNALKDSIPKCHNWEELKDKLQNNKISIEFKLKSGTNEVEGIKFGKNDYHFKGSKVDRQFSFSKIDYQLKQNEFNDNRTMYNIGMKFDNEIKESTSDNMTELSNMVSDILSIPLSTTVICGSSNTKSLRGRKDEKRKGFKR